MYRIPLILWVCFFAFIAFPNVTAAESETIVIQARRFPDGGFLRIQAIDTLILDAKGFLFPGERDNSDTSPDTIALHIQHNGGSFYYSMPFSTGQRRYELSAKSFRSRGGAPPFTGFPQGANAFLLVGTEVGGSSLDSGVFADQWNLMLDFE